MEKNTILYYSAHSAIYRRLCHVLSTMNNEQWNSYDSKDHFSRRCQKSGFVRPI